MDDDLNKCIEEIKNAIDNIYESNENDDTFVILNVLSSLLKNRKKKDLNDLKMKKEVDEVLDEIIDRPEFFFNSKENNIQKVIDTKKSLNFFPKTLKQKRNMIKELNKKSISRLFDKIINKYKSKDIIEDKVKILYIIDLDSNSKKAKKQIENIIEDLKSKVKNIDIEK